MTPAADDMRHEGEEWDVEKVEEFPSIPGYEIMGLLGRGGMGVVYQARQIGLNRLVALKMTLTAGPADSDSMNRFRAEAETVARLHHPNVVQVFAVGECNSLPYFSLEYCPGNSLDRKLATTSLSCQESAELVIAIASGVQAAHEVGVVHRDLKPANVLLDAIGTPKVSDFGLAKRLGESGRTVSGAVLGTPSYMAPEQAEGRGKAAGPTADVYALGAILYECLTGLPPFKAATPLETILQVIADEPRPVRRLNPSVPRDLEAVCLKCLEKNPAKRYSSAAELGEELQRFLVGDPTSARPLGLVRRGGRWVRRNPAAVFVLFLVFLGAVNAAFWRAAIWHFLSEIPLGWRAIFVALLLASGALAIGPILLFRRWQNAVGRDRHRPFA
jgi:serine/threonine-protein kinase